MCALLSILWQRNNIFPPAAYISRVRSTAQHRDSYLVVHYPNFPEFRRIGAIYYDVVPVRMRPMCNRT